MAVYVPDVDFISLYKSVVGKNRKRIESINNFIDIAYALSFVVYVTGMLFSRGLC